MIDAMSPLPNTPSWRGVQLKEKHRDNCKVQDSQRQFEIFFDVVNI
jgi:hypothetical protein